MSLLYMAMQLVVSLGFIYVCPLIVDKFAQEGQTLLCNSLVLVHWIYLFVAFIVLAVAYVLLTYRSSLLTLGIVSEYLSSRLIAAFKKKYYHLHEEYLASLKK